MNTKRLERLIQVLETVAETAPESFNMSRWVQRRRTPDRTTACGTACCAAGWAALDPVLQSEGLHLTNDDDETFSDLDALTRYLSNGYAADIYPGYGSATAFEALSLFFDIGRSPSYYIFDAGPASCRTIPEVIERIKEIMRGDYHHEPQRWLQR